MVKLSKETHLEMFTKMERIREFDSRINKLVRRGFVQGMTHFSVGEEAANVGAVQHLSYDDIFFSNHRGHGQSIAQDMDLNKMMAELAGKATGVSKGRGGSMHLADFKKGNYGTNGIVGGGYALAVGAALTQQYKNRKQTLLWHSLEMAQPTKVHSMSQSIWQLLGNYLLSSLS